MIKKGGIMKKFLLFSLLVGLFGGSQAQDLKPIKLNQPNVKRGLPVMTALQNVSLPGNMLIKNWNCRICRTCCGLLPVLTGLNQENGRLRRP